MASAKSGMLDFLIGIVLTIAFISAVLPTSLRTLNDMAGDSGNFTAPQLALLSILGIVIVISIVRGVIKWKA